MADIKQHNHKYTTISGSNVPIASGDRQWAQDKGRDFYFGLDRTARAINAILKNDLNNRIIQTGTVNQGSGDTINVPITRGIVKFSVDIPNSFAAIPVTVTQADIYQLVEIQSAQSNLVVTGGQISDNLYANATLDGSTINYVKLKYKEINGSIRQRSEATGTYVYEVSPSYEIRIEPVAPTGYEIELSKFTGVASGTFTFNTSTRTGWGFDIQKLTTNDLIVNNYNNGNKIDTVIDYNFTGGTETGAIEILLPMHSSGTLMPKLAIRIRTSDAGGTECVLYVDGGILVTIDWQGSTYSHPVIIGQYTKTLNLKFGYRTISAVKYPTIYIGDIADTWQEAKIQIVEIHGAQVDLPANWLDRANYAIDIIPALAGDYTNQYDVVPSVYGHDASVAGDLSVTGNLGIGGDADATYDLKVYGTSLFSDNLRIDSTTPFLILSKSDTSHGGIRFENDGVQRFYQYLSSSENYVLNRYDSGGVLVDVPLQVNGGTGDVTVANNLRVSGNLGIGGDADATYDLKVYGTSLLVGNSRITGNLGIGGNADATYDLKVYGDSYMVGNISVGNISVGVITAQVNSSSWSVRVTNYGTGSGVSALSSSGFGCSSAGGTYDFYAAGTGINYGPFTGAHQFTIDNDIDILPGMILAIDYVREWVKDAAFSLSTTFPHLKIATENDTPYCIYNYSHQLEEDDPDIFFTFNPAWKKGAGNALGEGWIMACDINGVPKKGDILVLSEFPGYAKVLNPDTPLTAAIFSKIVGKVIDDIDFSAYPNVSKYPNVSNITKGGLVPIVYLLG
jgi:hypothetical protein